MPSTVIDVVLDASAVLALLNREPGAQTVERALAGECAICSVNHAEVLTRLTDWGLSLSEAQEACSAVAAQCFAFDADLAVESAALRERTRSAGLSLGDRACLALGRKLGAKVLTADRPWVRLGLDVAVECIRPES